MNYMYRFYNRPCGFSMEIMKTFAIVLVILIAWVMLWLEIAMFTRQAIYLEDIKEIKTQTTQIYSILNKSDICQD